MNIIRHIVYSRFFTFKIKLASTSNFHLFSSYLKMGWLILNLSCILEHPAER